MEKTEKSTLLSHISGKAGNKEIMFLLYLVFFAAHLLISLSSHLPSIDPNEFTAAALANMFLGGDWTAAMSRSDYFYGFLQSILYIPALLITKDPFVQYRIMLVTNGAVMSFIPLVTYSLCLKLGVKKTWQAVCAAVCTGGWITYLVHSKFVWNETASVIIPFIMLYLLIKSDKAEKKSSKILLSVNLSFVCGLAYCAHQRLIAAILAVITAALLSRAVLKRKTLHLPVFFVSLLITMSAAMIGNYFVQNLLWGVSDPTTLNNTTESFIVNLPDMFKNGGVSRFFTALLSQAFYYICSSWGLGALTVSLLVITTVRLVKSCKGDKSQLVFGNERMVFLFFTAAITFFMLIIGAFYRFGAENFETSQSTVLFGCFLDGVIPFTVLLFFVFIYTEELTLVQILGGVVASGIVYLLFFFTGRTVALNAVSATISPMLGLYPVMFGENSGNLLTSTGFTAAVSCSMCVMTVFIVIVSCAKNFKQVVLSVSTAVVILYSAIYGVFGYLPISNAESVNKNAEFVRVSSYLYNASEAPSITAYECSRNCVMMLQYLNQNVKVYTADSVSDIQEDTYIVVPSETQIRFEGQPRVVFVHLAETENYKIYAYGERAKAYAQSQTGNEKQDQQPILQSES